MKRAVTFVIDEDFQKKVYELQEYYCKDHRRPSMSELMRKIITMVHKQKVIDKKKESVKQ